MPENKKKKAGERQGLRDALAPLTGREATFLHDEIIVSKTDPRGIVTYANDIFLRVSGFSEDEILGRPHSLIRHPDMPRCVFKLLWSTIAEGKEIFAYVVNRAKNGDHYWVFAHVTPSYDKVGNIVGYHSSRRVPSRAAVDKVIPLYKSLCDIEREYGGGEGMDKATKHLLGLLEKAGVSYTEFIFSL